MNLLDLAAADAQAILQDSAGGFGRQITVTDPSGTSAVIVGFATDIGHTVDPQTGIAISGRRAGVALPISALVAAGLGIPKAVASESGKPWRVAFRGFRGVDHTFKVSDAKPDDVLGVVECELEAYKVA